MPNRRSVLIGLGGLVAGGGALLGTGAFTTVEAERTVSVETAGDADAFLAMEPERDDNEYVSTDDGTIAINLDGNDEGADGLNQNAITTFENLVRVTNQGTETVTELTLEFTDTPAGVDASDTFSFTVSDPDEDDSDTVDNGENVLTGDNDVPSELGSGDAVVFGLEVDLINGGDDNALPDEGDYTLTITADAADD